MEDQVKCQGKGCNKKIARADYMLWFRTDAYGIPTGVFCDKCFDNNYPFHKDRYYDKAYAGEELEPEEI